MTAAAAPRPSRRPSAGRAPARLAEVLAPIGLVGLVGVLGLTGCSSGSLPRRDVCLAVVPALVAAPPRIDVLAVADGRLGRPTVEVTYRAADGRPATVTCAFAEHDADALPSGLVGVRTAEGDLPPARLYVLDRFWLADPAARAEGLARLRGVDAKR